MSDITLSGEFSKFDDDERLAFGWASITKLDGKPVIDKQGDFIDINELEKSAYEYVLSSRVGGEMHRKEVIIEKGAKLAPKNVATVVESMVFTPEKIAKMGLPSDFPEGWWIGFKVNDDEVWKSVKGGKYTQFSIHGVGKRVPVSKAEILKQEFIAKHLIGRHEQDDHDPNRKRNPRLAEAKAPHRRKDHRTKAERDRHKARGRKIARRIGEVTGLGVAAFSADVVRRVADGAEPEQAVRAAGEIYRRIGQAAVKGGKGIIGKSDGFSEDDVREITEYVTLEIAKHLIGRHDQKNHKRGEHKAIKSVERDAKQKAKDSVRQGDIAGHTQHRKVAEAARRHRKKKTTREQFKGEFADALAAGVKMEDAVRSGRVQVNKSEEYSMEEIAKRMYDLGYTSEDIRKHLIGSHDQKKHSKNGKKGHSRKQHGRGVKQMSNAERAALGVAGGVAAGVGLHRSMKGNFKVGEALGESLVGTGDSNPLKNPKFRSGFKQAAGGSVLYGAGAGGALHAAFAGNPNFKTQGDRVRAANKKNAEERKKQKVKKNLRRLDVIQALDNEFAKGEAWETATEALEHLATEFAELRKSGQIDREFDIPVEVEKYDDIADSVGEEVADVVYSKMDGEWVTFEEFLKAYAEVLESGDEDQLSYMEQFLS